MELFRALGVLLEPPVADHRPLAALLGLGATPDPAEHTDLFRLQLYPYASVYLGSEGMLGGDARDRIAGFWRALGIAPPEEPDELTLMLGAYAGLATAAGEGGEGAERARRVFLQEHLASWLFAYLEKLEELAPPYYRSWGRLLGEALAGELEAAGPPPVLPSALREAELFPDPRVAGSEAFLSALLAPARSGMILVRDDLARAARELGLGGRAGERRFVLKALLGQDPAAVLGWLGREAAGWAGRHAARKPLLGATAAHWQARAEGTADLVAGLAREAPDLAAVP
jgi:hypothetical protein